MSSIPDRLPTPPERPITVPMLVRGSFQNPFFVVVTFLTGLFVVLALIGHFRYPPDSIFAAVCWFLAGCCAFPSVVMAFWIVPRRRWLEVTLTGFVLTDRGRRRAYTDDQVEAISRRFKLDSSGAARHRVRLEVRREGLAERVDCAYSVGPGLADPLAPLWDRLVARLACRLREGLDGGAALGGDGWHVDASGLHGRAGPVLPLGRVAKVGYFDRKLCLWKDDEERPFLRLPAGSRNVQALGAFLWELTRARPDRDRPQSGQPLGRVVLERKGSGAPGVALMVLGLVAAFLLVPTAFLGKGSGPTRLPSYMLLAFLAAFVPGLFLCLRSLRLRLVFHEFGASQPGWRGRKELLFAEVGTVTWKPNTSSIILAPLPGLDRPTIRFSALRSGEDEGLAAMRDHVSTVLAHRWGAEVPRGPVPWTGRLRFLPGGLEYRPTGLLGDGGPVTVPYHLTSYRIENNVFRLFVPGQSGAASKESVAAPNFYPGLMLLNLIYQGCGRPAPAAGPAPAARDERITGRGPGRVTLRPPGPP
jgi:hypothetical protein